jgi:hypothetical protein
MNAARPAAAPDFAALLAASPDAYPQAVDLVRGLVLVIRMDEAAFRKASFLDDRILGPATQGAWLPGDVVSAAARRVADRRPVHFVFHSGHVGSTLLTRLLDETGAVLSLREPLPLRTLAEAEEALGRPESLLSADQFDGLLDMLLVLWSRGYASSRTVVVKATSSAGRLAPRILARAPSSRAVCLSLRAEPYIATLLGGANSLIDLRGHAPGRMRRLLAGRELAVPPVHALSAGELAALGWVTESLAHAAARAAAGERVLMIDFENFLGDLPRGLGTVVAHFGLPRDEAFLAAAGGHAVLRRYSKAPEQPFAPGERGERLAFARREYRDEIARGLAWIGRLARADAGIAALAGAGLP